MPDFAVPVTRMSAREQLAVELALHIDDPAGVEALDLAECILDTFALREPFQCQVMTESLRRWALQFPRRQNGTTGPITERNPPTTSG
jgi:hypothetical protein